MAGRVLSKKDFAAAAVGSAAMSALLLPTTGRFIVGIPSSGQKAKDYARKQERAQGITSPVWGAPKKLKGKRI